jgi:hypothetical protein
MKLGCPFPLYRQSEVYGYAGVPIDRSTLTQWVGAAGRLVSPLVAAVRRYVLGGGQLHADDTPLPVLDPGRGRTKTGYLWTYVRDERPWGSNMVSVTRMNEGTSWDSEHGLLGTRGVKPSPNVTRMVLG